MKRLLLLISFSILFLYSFTQNDVQRDNRVSPVLKLAATQKNGYITYGRSGSSRFINIAVLNQSSRTLCWFTCHGRLFDSTRLTVQEYEQITKKQFDPFELYQSICNKYLAVISAAKDIYRIYGIAFIDSLNDNYRALFAMETVLAAKTPLQKLIAIENVRNKILTQLAYLNCGNPFGLQNDPLYKISNEQAGVMIKTKDSTVYFNIDPTSAVAKICLNKKSPGQLYILNRFSEIVDSVSIQQKKYDLLQKEKTDVFLLYRGWLELQWQGTLSAIRRQGVWPYSQASIQSEKSDNGLYSQLNAIGTKINQLNSPEAKSIEQAVYDTYKNETSEISYIPLLGIGYSLTQTRGQKEYELTNHLGNILAIVSDKKFGVPSPSNSSLIDYYEPDIVSAQDYYPFGMLQPGRSYLSSTASLYRFGFNGKENDNEVKGEGNQLDYGMRVYDPRLGKFLSKDPLQAKFPFYTPYQFAGNKPIWAVDLDGREDIIYNLVNAKKSDGKPILSLQFVEKRDYNPITRKVAELNDIPTTYYVMYNGEQVGTYSSEQEMKLATHGKTVDQLRKIENDRMFRNMLGAAILHAHEGLKASEGRGSSRGAATVAEEEAVATRSQASAIATEANFEPMPSISKVGDVVFESFPGEGAGTYASYGETSLGWYTFDKTRGVEFDLNIPENLQDKGLGTVIFDQAMNATNAKTFTATWVESDRYPGGISSNLATYRKTLKETNSVNKAAWETWSGRQAKTHGFNKVEVTDLKDGGVQAVFSK